MKTFSIFPIRYKKVSSANFAGYLRLLTIVFSAIFPLCMSATGLAQVQLGADIDGEAAGDESGSEVSLSSDGSRVAIGANGNAGNGEGSGHVRVYQWSGTDWQQMGDDIDGEVPHDNSGSSVSLSSDGNRLAISSVWNGGNGRHSGHVRVFHWSGTDWQQLGMDIDGEAVEDFSGSSVSLSSDGDRLAIGAPFNDGNGDGSGHVRVFQWSGTDWQQLGIDIDGEAGGDDSGYSVSLSSDGNRLAVGAIGNDGNGADSGHVRVFQWSGTDWQQLGIDIDGEAAGDKSGWPASLSADGNRLAIGARNNDSNGEDSGQVRVYEWNGSSWQQMGADIDGEAAGDHSGGWFASLSSAGDRLAIGANTDNATDSDHVRVYQWSGSDWVQLGTDIEREAADDSRGEVTLSSDGNRLAVGAKRNDGNGDNSGHVRVYDLSMFNEFQINPGLNDAWYFPDTSGQGFFITAFPDLNYVTLAWFTYDTELPAEDAPANLGDPGHRWLTAGGPIDGNQALMNIEMTSGGIFDTASEIIRTDPPGSDGTIILTFDDCNSGTIEYDIPSINRQGIVPIRRVANDNIVICEALSTN